MKAQVLDNVCDLTKTTTPLRAADAPVPEPGPKEVLLRIRACGVCHTELDEIEGRTPPSSFPRILGHQVVGVVERLGPDCSVHAVGDRLGVAWIFSACGQCELCRSGEENLCPEFRATGRDADGGYAEYMVVSADFACPIPETFTDAEAAPLLCAGAIGCRSMRLTNLTDGQRLGLTGFGASAHLVLKMVKHRYPEMEVFVFARNEKEREFARELGAVWAGATEDVAPAKLHAIIDTTPAWKPVVDGLKNLAPGGRLVINAIRKEAADQNYLQQLSYHEHLWLEREIKSVANVARRDVQEFLALAAEVPIKPDVREYPLDEANQALLEVKRGGIRGAKVLRV